MSIVDKALAAKKRIDNGEATREEVVSALNLDQHECSVWQCVFEKDDAMCLMLELNMVEKMAKKSKRECLKAKDDVLLQLTAMLAVAVLSQCKPHWTKTAMEAWLTHMDVPGFKDALRSHLSRFATKGKTLLGSDKQKALLDCLSNE